MIRTRGVGKWSEGIWSPLGAAAVRSEFVSGSEGGSSDWLPSLPARFKIKMDNLETAARPEFASVGSAPSGSTLSQVSLMSSLPCCRTLIFDSGCGWGGVFGDS